MESRFLTSRSLFTLGERLVGKLFGTDAIITDRLTITRKGNILIPKFWYYPDENIVATVRSANKKTTRNPNSFIIRPTKKIIIPIRTPTVGLRIMRNSPTKPQDEGWDQNKHPALIKSVTQFHQTLTSIIDHIQNLTFTLLHSSSNSHQQPIPTRAPRTRNYNPHPKPQRKNR